MGDNRFVKISQIVLVLLLIASIGLNIYLLTKKPDIEVVEKITTEVKHDTITDSIPKLVEVNVIKYKKVPVYMTDTVVRGDTVYMDLPIEQRKYTDDSTYTAYVSGYDPKLDSINIFRKTIFENHTITIKEKDKRKIVFGPTISAGYDFNNKQVGYSVGIGLTWPIFGF